MPQVGNVSLRREAVITTRHVLKVILKIPKQSLVIYQKYFHLGLLKVGREKLSSYVVISKCL